MLMQIYEIYEYLTLVWIITYYHIHHVIIIVQLEVEYRLRCTPQALADADIGPDDLENGKPFMPLQSPVRHTR